MNDLDLPFDDETPGGKGRHRRRGSRAGRSLIALTVVVVLLGGLAFGGWMGVSWLRDTFTTPDYTGAGAGAVTVEVLPGQNASQIAQTLYQHDVVASPQAFVDAANANPDSVGIQPGFYELPQQLPAARAVEMLLDEANRLTDRVTIPEGLSMFRTFDLLADQLDIPVEEFEEAAEDPLALGIPDWWFNRTDEVEFEPTVEGFLFPSTYEFPPDPTAEEVLQTMINQFFTVTDDMGFVERVESERNIAPYEALIVASLAQAEAGVPGDLAKVARVAYNRLYVHNMPLEYDVTVNYWFELNGEPTKSSAEMTTEEMTDPANPYRRNRTGLVPTPINNPSELALEGAMDPPEGDWLFFVAVDDEGNSAFAETYEQHCRYIEDAIEAGILNESC